MSKKHVEYIVGQYQNNGWRDQPDFTRQVTVDGSQDELVSRVEADMVRLYHTRGERNVKVRVIRRIVSTHETTLAKPPLPEPLDPLQQVIFDHRLFAPSDDEFVYCTGDECGEIRFKDKAEWSHHVAVLIREID